MNLYNKYRPVNFNEIIGHDLICKILQGTIKNNKIANCYLFTGNSGIGKTTLIKVFTQGILCKDFNGESCKNCDSCKAFVNKKNKDFVHKSGTSFSTIDDIRNFLNNDLNIAPIYGKKRVVLIDEFHLLTKLSQNTLLEILEETPPHLVFILVTSEPQNIIDAILTRVQRFDLKQPTGKNISDILMLISEKEKIDLPEKIYNYIINNSGNSFRKAINLLEELSIIEDIDTLKINDINKSSINLVNYIIQKDLKNIINIISSMQKDEIELLIDNSIVLLLNEIKLRLSGGKNLDLTSSQILIILKHYEALQNKIKLKTYDVVSSTEYTHIMLCTELNKKTV